MGARDREPRNIISFRNGLLDLDRYLRGDANPLLPHTPAWYSLTCLPHDYSPEAKCPQWLNFLDEVFEGDEERIHFLRQWFGYCLSAETTQEKFVILKGPPRCGKSTIATLLGLVVGSHNVGTPLLRSLGGEFGLHGLVGKMVATCG